MHLFVYTRHSAKCPRRKDRFWRRCHCPKWIRGFLGGIPVRASARTTDWEQAEAHAREMEHPSPPAQPPIQGPALPEEKPAYRITIEEVVEALLDDGQGRQLRKGATGRSKTLLQTQLIPWAHQRTLRYLDELTASVLTRFRAHWSKDLANSQNTARRKHERLCGFDEVAAIPDAAVKALTTPVSLTGTAEEIDAGGSRERLSGARSSPSPSPSLQVMVRFVFMEVGGLTCIKRSILVNTKAAKDE